MLPNFAYASNLVVDKQEVIPQQYICTSDECANALLMCEHAIDPKLCMKSMHKEKCIPCLSEYTQLGT